MCLVVLDIHSYTESLILFCAQSSVIYRNDNDILQPNKQFYYK